MKMRREMCVFILWLMLAPLAAWLGSARVQSAEVSAQEALDLTNSRGGLVKEGTHGTGSPCIDGLMVQVVAQGAATALGASCVEQIHLRPFVTQAQVDQSNGKKASR